MSPVAARRVLNGLLAGVAGMAAAGGAAQLAVHGRLFAARMAFPLDLEWMEGGLLVHALRLAEGQSIYPSPSVDFIPFLYTPLYPALLALLSKIVGLSYFLGRAMSVAGFVAAAAILVVLAAREAPAGGRPGSGLAAAAIGVAGAGAVVAGYGFSGAFYDLVRSDSLLLALEAAALALAFAGRGLGSAAAAALCIVLAFLTKQTAAPVGIAIGCGLLAASPKRGLVYGVFAAGLLVFTLAALTKATGGWFWTYVFRAHQGHDFVRRMALVEAPLRLLGQALLVYLALFGSTLILGLGGRLERRDAVLWAAAAGGFAASCIGFGTQWAFENAFIPGVFFPALAATVLAARLVVAALSADKPALAAAAALAAIALGVQPLRAGLPDHRRLIPAPEDEAAAVRLLDMIRSRPGDVFIPFHPYYAVLAGKRPFVHRMGVMDVTRSGLGRPRGLDEGFLDQRWPTVILDWKSWSGEWHGLESRYRVERELRDGVDSVRSFSGAATSPRTVWVPASRPPRPQDRAVLADFESGSWAGWLPEGDAFGPGPAPAPAGDGGYGRYAADSGRGGPMATGSLRSPVIRLDRPRLSFVLEGPPDPALRVLLVGGPETARSVTPAGGRQVVDWDVRDLAGREMFVLVEDRSPRAHLRFDQLVAH